MITLSVAYSRYLVATIVSVHIPLIDFSIIELLLSVCRWIWWLPHKALHGTGSFICLFLAWKSSSSLERENTKEEINGIVDRKHVTKWHSRKKLHLFIGAVRELHSSKTLSRAMTFLNFSTFTLKVHTSYEYFLTKLNVVEIFLAFSVAVFSFCRSETDK